MMNNCPVCGKYHCIHWPEHWVYRRGETYYCSAMCMDVDIVRDMNILKQVREDRRKRKEAKRMEKMKKDGTPAKKPGPKKKDGIAQVKVDGALRIETPEANKIEIVETPEKPKQIYNPVKYDGMVIREVEGLFGRYRRSDVGGAVYIDFENADRIVDTLSFTAEQWRSFGKEFVKCARILGVEM